MHRTKAGFIALAAIASTVAVASSAQAALSLTAAGVADGFNLSTFYSDPGTYYGALGATTMANGQVIVAGYGHGQIMTFADTDGQTYASALNKATVTQFGTPYEVATVGGQTYYAPNNGAYYSVNPTTLALTPLSLTPSTTSSLGLWANQVTGDLISSSTSGLVDINPTTGVVHVIAAIGGIDGVSVSPDGTIAYAEDNSSTILGYNIATGTLVLNDPVAHSPDGTGVISGGTFNGDIVVNNNDGTVGLLDPGSGVETIIASGGTRGDFVGPDLTNGTLFLSEADSMLRLGIAGGSIGGGPPPGVPEPSAWAMMLLGFGGLGAVLRRRRTHADLQTA